jgi:subtilisin family serine protease
MCRLWIEYDKKDYPKVVKLIRKMDGKIIKKYDEINYLLAQFKSKGELDLATVILSSLKKYKYIKNVKRDIKLSLCSNDMALISNINLVDNQKYIDGLDIRKLLNMNLKGKGVNVAILDSGVRKSFFKDKKIKCYGGEDRIGHGTVVADILFNIAPEINLYSFKLANDKGEIETVDVIDTLYKIGNSKNIDIVNMSFGGEEYDDGTSPICKMIDYIVKKKNKIVVVASGNLGKDGISYPASSKEAITVGAIDGKDRIASFSSYGKTKYGYKPDVVAYGVNILCRKPNKVKVGSKLDNMLVVSGTSFASPMVSGVIALLKEKYKVDIKKIKEALYKSALKRSIVKGMSLSNLIENVVLSIMHKLNIDWYLRLLEKEAIDYDIAIGNGKVQGYKTYLYLKGLLSNVRRISKK